MPQVGYPHVPDDTPSMEEQFGDDMPEHDGDLPTAEDVRGILPMPEDHASDELIERLNEWADLFGESYRNEAALMSKAATALTAQEAEIARLKYELDRALKLHASAAEDRKSCNDALFAAEAALAEAHALLESLAPLSEDNSPIRKWLATLADTGAKR